MANVKISGLPTVTSLDTQSLVPAVKNGETAHITFENLMLNSSLVEANSGGSDDTITITQSGQAKKIKVRTLLDLMIFAEVNGVDIGEYFVVSTSEGSRRVSFENLMDNSSLVEATSSALADTMNITQSGQAKKITIQTLKSTFGGGATGGGLNKIFHENDVTVTDNYTIPTGKNAMTAGPITINNGITVTVPNGSSWTIV